MHMVCANNPFSCGSAVVLHALIRIMFMGAGQHGQTSDKAIRLFTAVGTRVRVVSIVGFQLQYL